MLVTLTTKGIVININKNGGIVRLNTGKIITCVHKEKLTIGQNVLVHNNTILNAEEKP